MTSAGRVRSIAELVSKSPQGIPEVSAPFRKPKMLDGEVYVQFSKEEVEKSAEPFRFAIVLKCIRQRPSLDRIRVFIHERWGLSVQPMVSAMRRPRNVFVRFSIEEDFLKPFSRESCDVDGVTYRLFQWTTEFTEESEPALVPVWLMLPGLPPNYYHEAFLKSITAPIGMYLRRDNIGMYLRRDNATRCATRTDGARVCVLMNIAQEPIKSFWIGTPKNPKSIFQEVLYETLPAFCLHCKVQGHNLITCRASQPEGKDKRKKTGVKSACVWAAKSSNPPTDNELAGDGKLDGKPDTPVHSSDDLNELETVVDQGEEVMVSGYETKADDALAVQAVHVVHGENNARVLSTSADRILLHGENSGAQNKGILEVSEVVCAQVENVGTFLASPLGASVGCGTEVVDLFEQPITEEGELVEDGLQAVACVRGKENVSVSDDEGALPHLGKEKDDHSDSEITVKEGHRGRTRRSKLWVFWDAEIQVDVLGVSNQQISLLLNSSVVVSFVYAKCRYLERRNLWAELLQFCSLSLPWIVIGDFNVIREDGERRGGCPRLPCAMEEFCNFIDAGGLMEIPSSGNKLSWCNGQSGMARSWARLDRALCNVRCLELFPSVSLKYLARHSSDHTPMLLGLADPVLRYGPSSFKFQQMWTLHEDFWRCVSSNKEVFGWTGAHIKRLEAQVEEGEASLQEGFSEDVENDVLAARLELSVRQKREEIRIAQQVKNNWMDHGEINSSFFKAMQVRRARTVTEMQLSDGRVLSSPEDIHDAAVVYFQELLQSHPSRVLPDLSTLIQADVVGEENHLMCCIPSEKEIKDALFSIPTASSPGPDSFGSGFFQHCWSLVKADLMEAIWDFFRGSPMPRFYTSSFIVLIPKVLSPTSFDQFRPISLCSVVYKICSKILVARLNSVLSRIVSLEQGAFLPRRSIFDNISLTQELAHDLNKSGSVFRLKFVNLLSQCVTTPWYSVIMNGTAKGFFKSGRGLRQGDPLSPYLFILVEEIFSRLLKQKFEEDKIGFYSHPRRGPFITHLLYADDMMIFANGSKKSVKEIKNTLSLYAQWSGQRVNERKSSIFFSKTISATRRHELLLLTGFSEGKFPVKYLGVPIISGRMKGIYVEELVQCIRRKIEGWKVKLLSSGARLILLKHVIVSMPVHLLAVLQVPKAVLLSLHKMFSSFFWGSVNGKSKRKWIKWDILCKPIDEEGVGLRSLFDIQNALHFKFAWKLLTANSLWTRFF
ncbi:hypothetical protein F2P56_012795 [Juglans regia]|uniref:Uncharacterized protein LOC109015758 n=2 Tax=Juglans regia TaxID=51240 RepID=A0A2I4HC76_JUGRE|nr:uncharacterized protein LOC109015758 [Juglans regia]KAF5468656.1 hypothetical protein F2P56_012795 [Juglans regia]